MDQMGQGLVDGRELAELPDDFTMSKYYTEYAAGLIVGHIAQDQFTRGFPDYVTAGFLHDEYKKYSVKQDLIFMAIRRIFTKEIADEVIHCFVSLQETDDSDDY